MQSSVQPGDTGHLIIKAGDTYVRVHSNPRCGSKTIKNLLVAAASGEDSCDYLDNWIIDPNQYEKRKLNSEISAETKIKYLRSSEEKYRSNFEEEVSDLPPVVCIAIVQDPMIRFVSALNNLHMRIIDWEHTNVTYLAKSDREKNHFNNTSKKLRDLFSPERLTEFKPLDFIEYQHIKPYEYDPEAPVEGIVSVLSHLYSGFILTLQSETIDFSKPMTVYRTCDIDTKIKPMLEEMCGRSLPDFQSNKTIHKHFESLDQNIIDKIKEYYSNDFKIYNAIEASE